LLILAHLISTNKNYTVESWNGVRSIDLKSFGEKIVFVLKAEGIGK